MALLARGILWYQTIATQEREKLLEDHPPTKGLSLTRQISRFLPQASRGMVCYLDKED